MKLLTLAKESNLSDDIRKHIIFKSLVSIINQLLLKIDFLLKFKFFLVFTESIKLKLELARVNCHEVSIIVNACKYTGLLLLLLGDWDKAISFLTIKAPGFNAFFRCSNEVFWVAAKTNVLNFVLVAARSAKVLEELLWVFIDICD